MPSFILFKNQKLKILLLNSYLAPFCISFALVGFYIFPLPDLLMGGGDAASIWQTITTFRSEKITSSYVLYKGFLSIYPYIWLLELSIFLKLDAFFFIKLYHVLLFSFVAAIGVPYTVSKILSVEIKLYKNIIFVLVLFQLTKFTGIFQMLMVDLPSWTFFVAGIVFFMLPAHVGSINRIIFLLISGGFIGLAISASGQYSLAGYFLIIYVLASLFMEGRHKNGSRKINLAILALLFVIGIAIPKIYDSHFHQTIVQPMRDNGEWLPTGHQWLVSGMTRLMPTYKFGYPNTSHRGLAILKETEGDKFPERYEVIKLGGGAYSVPQYLSMIRENPLDFAVIWATKTFLAVSFDGGEARASHLLISYTSLYICLYLIFLKCIYFRDLLNRNSLIFLSIISTIAAPVFLSIEMRYIVAVQSFMLGFAIHQEKVFDNIKNYLIVFNKRHDKSGFKRINCLSIPYPAMSCVLFLILCFTLYGALLEIPGSDPAKVLFKW